MKFVRRDEVLAVAKIFSSSFRRAIRRSRESQLQEEICRVALLRLPKWRVSGEAGISEQGEHGRWVVVVVVSIRSELD